MIVEGTILRGETLEPVEGRVVVEDGEITAIEETTVESDDIVAPAFVNAHTHLGDSIAKEAGAGLSLDELVAPPDGLKHQLLRESSRDEQIQAMVHTLRFMANAGTGAFLDFREGGVEGVEALQHAVRDAATDTEGLGMDSVVFGRETPAVLDIADGFGASGARDNEFDAERQAARETSKPFAIHAGERDGLDIDAAFEYDPHHLVHMVYAEQRHLERLAAEDVPVVVCPRSNCTTGVGIPPLEELSAHTTVGLGTDNVMLNSPSMFREMALTEAVSGLDARAVLQMATVNGADILGVDCGVIATGRAGKLVVLDGASDNLSGVQDPVRGVVRRAGVGNVKTIIS